MQCEQIEQRLQGLLDSRQDIDSDDELREHVELCTQCANLATAYGALARRPSAKEQEPIAGLASRVVAEVVASAPTKTQGVGHVPWRAWCGLAIAASLLVAVGIAFNEYDDSAPTNPEEPLVVSEEPATENLVADAETRPDEATPLEVAGSQMWYRTGQGLASITLASLRFQRNAPSDTESHSDQQLLDRAFNTIRTLWPREGAITLPSNGETGWREPAHSTLVA